jgi:DNA-binding MarR family transcriptional regulator
MSVIDGIDPGEGAQAVPAKLDGFVPFLLNQVTSLFNDRLKAALRSHNVSVPQWRILSLLKIDGPQNINGISEKAVISQPTVSKVIDQLEQAMLVVRRPLAENRRVVQVMLSPQGDAMIDAIFPLAIDARDRALRGVAGTDRDELVRILQTVFTNLRMQR